MVLSDVSTWPGVVVRSVPIGVVRITQREAHEPGRAKNDRILAVPADDARAGEYAGPPERIRKELDEFFVTSARMTGKSVNVEGWEGDAVARDVIRAAAERFRR